MIVLDIETSWADPYSNSIVSIWAIELENPSNLFYEECRIFEWALIQDEALMVNWFSKEEITDVSKKSVNELLLSFMKWCDRIDDRTIWWHNVGYFDLRFLEENSNKCWLKNSFWLINWNYRTIDLHTVAYAYLTKNKLQIPFKNNLSSLNLDFILSLVWLPSEPRPHNALNWAKYEAEAFSRFLYGKKLFEEFKKYDLPEDFKI